MRDLSILKKCGVVLLSSLLILLPLGCTTQEKAEYQVPETMTLIDSEVVAQNDKYCMRWDSEQNCILLEDLQSGHIWSTLPYDYYLEGETNASLSSPLFINYYDPEYGTVDGAKAYSACIRDDLMSIEKIQGGLRLWFYFQDVEITVPLDFKLREDSVEASVDASLIEESGLTRLVSVTVAPYFCSTLNSAEKDRYLFLPVGSGALMYTQDEIQGISRLFSAELYGTDAARRQLEISKTEEAMRLPVFGVVEGDQGLCAIIEKGSASALIEAEAGNYRNGHSAVYATFNLRGYDEAEVKQLTIGNAVYGYAQIYAEEYHAEQVFSVGYYPLTGAEASYAGMASVYRTYLKKSGILADTSVQQSYRVNLLGGATIKKTMLGFPSTGFVAATTFEQAQTILKDLQEALTAKPEVMLEGFGQTGVDVGQIGGGFAFANALGSAAKQKQLEAYCKEQGIPLYTDFDVVQFSGSGNGFSVSFDTAKTANRQAAYWQPDLLNLPAKNSSVAKIGLLKRSLLPDAVSKLNKFAKDRISGISLSTLGDIAYSDYNTYLYYAKGSMAEQVQELLTTIREEGHPLTVRGGNAYAAMLASSVSDVPLNNGGYDLLDESVPFYQMVFRGHTALYSEPINLTAEWRETLLAALSVGVSPTFMLCNSCDETLINQSKADFYGSVYGNNRDRIVETVGETAAFYDSIQGAELVQYTTLQSGVTQSKFSNGVTVTVNNTDGTIIIGGRSIEARSFVTGDIVVEEGGEPGESEKE